MIKRFRVNMNISTLKKSRDYQQRQKAAKNLGRLGDISAVESLIQALEDSYEDVQCAAAEALGWLGDIRAVEPLILKLGKRKRGVDKAAARALGDLGDPRAVEPLINRLKLHDYTGTRMVAIRSLGQIGDIRAIEPLIQEMGYGDRFEKSAASKALLHIGSPSVEPLIRYLETWRSNIAPWSIAVRRGAARTLGQLGDLRAVEPLIRALKDREYYVREEVAMALGRLGDARAKEPLICLLTDGYKEVRQAAAKALQNLGYTVVV